MYYLTRCHIVYLATLNMSNQHPSRFPKESLAWVVGIFVWEAFPIRTHRVHSYPLVERLPFVLNNRPGIRSQGYTDHSMRQRGTDARKKPTTANCMNEEGFPPSLPAHWKGTCLTQTLSRYSGNAEQNLPPAPWKRDQAPQSWGGSRALGGCSGWECRSAGDWRLLRTQIHKEIE